MTLFLKALGSGRQAIHGGSGAWPAPGTWTAPIDPIPCERGWHVCSPRQMLSWLPSSDRGDDIWTVEVGGEVVYAISKAVAERARLVRRLDWSPRSARLFACDCAEQVLGSFGSVFPSDSRPGSAIEVARRYAEGSASQAELAAAESAAWDAVSAAAGAGAYLPESAAVHAARAAAWASHPEVLAGAAASEARAAVRRTAGVGVSAGWDLGREEQSRLLLKHLGVTDDE